VKTWKKNNTGQFIKVAHHEKGYTKTQKFLFRGGV
jgi:hypothetical protein